jgi:voltage-gated potassium channel
MPGVPRPNLIQRQLSRFVREPESVRFAAGAIVTTTLVIVVVSGVAMRVLDHREYSSIWEGMWWALQTVTTVGYGDVTPKNVSGKFVGTAVMLEGVAFVAIVTAAITSTFVERAQARRGSNDATKRDLAAQRLDSQLQDLTERLARVEQSTERLARVEQMLIEISRGPGSR